MQLLGSGFVSCFFGGGRATLARVNNTHNVAQLFPPFGSQTIAALPGCDPIVSAEHNSYTRCRGNKELLNI